MYVKRSKRFQTKKSNVENQTKLVFPLSDLKLLIQRKFSPQNLSDYNRIKTLSKISKFLSENGVKFAILP